MKIEDFAEKQTHYTGANNKKKWVITNREVLYQYLAVCNFRPGTLKALLGTSYATVKRFLCAAGLWDQVVIRTQKVKGGRKRTTTHDKFGYKYAEAEHDYVNERGEIIRRFEHIVNAEKKIGRPLSDSEVVHHIDGNKSNNSIENLHVCKDNSVHRLLHGSLERAAFEAVQSGIIKFHQDHGYYLDNKVGVVV
jgi:hypothetical protein